ncbi:MAG: hypothetical protein JWQ09_1609 [Segetibacter sp.]|nr:hypothetical protein [Segetibacter sp.]
MIFVSYSWKYKDKTIYFIQSLKDSNKKIWIDDEKLDLQLSIANQLELAIKECDEFIQLVSFDLPNTFWMNFEYQIALKVKEANQIKIIEIESLCVA